MSKETQQAFIFPGQGSQKVGMGEGLLKHPYPDLAQIAQRTYEEAQDVLEMDFAEICQNDPENQLDSTRITQPALLVTSIAAFRMLNHLDYKPDVVAGHSMGEYSAVVAAEALSFEQALRLVKARGEFMEEAGEINPGKMAAILRLPVEQVAQICEESGAQLANINSEQQIVISGSNETVTYASRLAADKKGKVIGLNVSIAAHSSLMEPAQQQMEMLLSTLDVADPTVPFVANVHGNYMHTADEVRRGLVNQMTGSVLWLDSVKRMIGDGVGSFIEVGPGEVLSNIIKRIDKTVDTQNSDTILSKIVPGKSEEVILIENTSADNR